MTINSGSQAPSVLRDFRVLMILFIGLRVVLLMARPPDGLMAYGEFQNFYYLADLTRETGKLPFIGYWSEYPPLFVWLNLGLHQLLIVARGMPDHTYFYSLSFIGFVADIGNLTLVYRIGSKIYGDAKGLDIAWVYAMVGVPIVFIMWNFESLTTFFMLLGLWWLMQDKDLPSAAAAAAGTLTKIMPGLLTPVAWRYRSPKKPEFIQG